MDVEKKLLGRNTKFLNLAGGYSDLGSEWRLFEAFRQDQNQKFSYTVQLKRTVLKFRDTLSYHSEDQVFLALKLFI